MLHGQSVKTPDGVVDILLEDAQLKSYIEGKLCEVFRSWGFAEVITPTFEFHDVFRTGGIDLKRIYKLSDPEGNILALRADLTTPVARVVATRLREAPKPLRLYYIGNVFRLRESERGGRDEFTQAGVELIGSDLPCSDAEVIAIAIESLERLGIEEFQINLGQIDFFKGIVEHTSLSEAEVEMIKERIDKKDIVGLEKILKKCDLPEVKRSFIRKILSLCGGEETIERALTLVDNDSSQKAVENLGEVYRILGEYGLKDRVVIDLGEVRGFGYYTGVMFEGFSRWSGSAILNGGRYDDLIAKFGYPCPAVGFAIDIERIKTIVQKEGLVQLPKIDRLIRFTEEMRGQAYKAAKALREKGETVELEVMKRGEVEAISYAQAKRIGEIIAFDHTCKKVISLQTDVKEVNEQAK
jgi:ATP phosphoribosyltransferase regulatory subunit